MVVTFEYEYLRELNYMRKDGLKIKNIASSLI